MNDLYQIMLFKIYNSQLLNMSRFFIFIFVLMAFVACNPRSKCPAYADVQNTSITEGGQYDPTAAGVLYVKRNKKNNLTSEKEYTATPSTKAKQIKTDKNLKSDPSLFPDLQSKKVKKQKKNASKNKAKTPETDMFAPEKNP